MTGRRSAPSLPAKKNLPPSPLPDGNPPRKVVTLRCAFELFEVFSLRITPSSQAIDMPTANNCSSRARTRKFCVSCKSEFVTQFCERAVCDILFSQLHDPRRG